MATATQVTIDMLQIHNTQRQHKIDKLTRERDTLRLQLETESKDAARYHWIREEAHLNRVNLESLIGSISVFESNDEIDDLIDREMSKWGFRNE